MTVIQEKGDARQQSKLAAETDRGKWTVAACLAVGKLLTNPD